MTTTTGPKTRRLNIRIPMDLLEAVQQAAEDRQITVSQMIREGLKLVLQRGPGLVQGAQQVLLDSMLDEKPDTTLLLRIVVNGQAEKYTSPAVRRRVGGFIIPYSLPLRRLLNSAMDVHIWEMHPDGRKMERVRARHLVPVRVPPSSSDQLLIEE